MSIRAESNSFPVDPLVFPRNINAKLDILFNWLDLLASEQPKTDAGNTPSTKLILNTKMHEVRENPEDLHSKVLSLISPNSPAKFEFIRFPVTADRKIAETIANFTFMHPGGTAPHTISAEIKEEQNGHPSDGDLETKHKIFSLHDVNMSGREPKTIEEQEHRADLLNKFRMIINQLFFQNSLKEIISGYKTPQEVC
jgi:hypothetical protein